MDQAPAISRRRDAGSRALLRGAIAVLALYAFVLQAFLGGLMPMPAAADGLCAQHAASDPAPGKSLPQGHGDCCTAAQVVGAALPPRIAATDVAWIAGSGAPAPYGRVGRLCARAPPDRVASPRGPPSA